MNIFVVNVSEKRIVTAACFANTKVNLINPLSTNINMQILPTICSTFPLLPVGRIYQKSRLHFW